MVSDTSSVSSDNKSFVAAMHMRRAGLNVVLPNTENKSAPIPIRPPPPVAVPEVNIPGGRAASEVVKLNDPNAPVVLNGFDASAMWDGYDALDEDSASPLLELLGLLEEDLAALDREEAAAAEETAAVASGERSPTRGGGGGGGGPRKSVFAGVVYEEAGGGGGGGGGGEKGGSSVEEQVGEIRQQLRGAAAFWKRAQTASLAAVRLGGGRVN